MDIRQQIVTSRKALRWHRDQRKHDRCWLDDWFVYEVILGIRLADYFPSFEACMTLCKQYHSERSGPPIPHQDRAGEAEWDDDLKDLDIFGLITVHLTIVMAAIKHYTVGEGKRKRKDDFEFYAVLP